MDLFLPGTAPKGGRARRALCHPLTVALALGITIVAPFAIWENSWAEWGNAYWFLALDADAVRSTGFPTRFIHSTVSGNFYPHFVFYAGGTLGLLAYPAALLGPWVTFLGSLVLAYSGAFLGAYWLLAAMRVSRGKSLLLACAAVLSPYAITNLYGRGSWAEIIGSSLVWLALGAGAQLLSASSTRRSRTLFAAGVSAAVCGIALTHNISLLLGVPFLVLIWPLVGLLVGPGWRGMVQRWLMLVAATLVGLTASAAWLLPNVRYGSDTAIASWDLTTATRAFDSAAVVLSPFLTFPEAQRAATAAAYGTPSQERLFNQTLSIGLVVIAVATLALMIRIATGQSPLAGRARGPLAAALGLTALGAILFVLMTNTDAWASLPSVARTIQFPYRLNPYLTITIVALVGLAIRGPGRWKSVAVALLTTWYAALAVYQVGTARPVAPPGFDEARHARISPDDLPPIFQANTAPPNQFRIVPAAPVTPPVKKALIDERGNAINPRDSGRVSTNVVCSPFVSAVPPARIVGATEDGFCVVDLGGARSPAVAPAWPSASILGIGLSVLGVLIAGTWVTLGLRRRASQES